MTQKLDFYRCSVCGNIVQVFHAGAGELVCCEKPMEKLVPFTQDQEKQEKHVPIFTGFNEIQVGSDLHPMTEEHHIEFIQCISPDKKHIETRFLDKTEEPKMKLCGNFEHNCALEYCNIHGLWEGRN